MAGMTDLAIRIATTMDATGINKADKSVKGLDKTIKKLGRTLGVTLGHSPGKNRKRLLGASPCF